MEESLSELIREIENDNSIQIPDILSGYSGKKILKLLSLYTLKLMPKDTIYLEIGVFQGLTLLSVANNNPEVEVYGIDNFAYFDKDGKNHSIVKNGIENLKLTNVNVINRDFEDALENLDKHIGEKKIGLFFVDGPHDYRSQLMCLLLAKPYLADNALIVIDDCNYEHVRQANRDFLISNQNFNLVCEAYTDCHPRNLHSIDPAMDGWWNGINVLLKQDKGFKNQNFPITQRIRDKFEGDHLVHSSKYPLAANQLLDIYSTTRSLRLDKAIVGLLKLIFSKAYDKRFVGRYRSTNTFSEGLTAFNLFR